MNTNWFKQEYSYIKRYLRIQLGRYFEKPLEKYTRKKLQRLLKENDKIVIIYTIGKVGSSSVYETLKNSESIPYPVFHLHSLSTQQIEEWKQYYKSSQRKSIPYHLIVGSVLSDLLKSYKGKIFLVTLIREPIQREVSSIFQDSFNFTSSSKLKEKGIQETTMNYLEKLVDQLPEEKWFKKEIKEVFDIDVYADTFDPAIGYKTYDRNNVRLLLIRIENLNTSFNSACKELFENNDLNLKLEEANIGDQKFYSEDYKKIRRDIRLDEKQVEQIIQTPFIQKFYPDYISSIKKDWIKSSDADKSLESDDVE